MKIAITGGICSGKSTVRTILEKRGIEIIDADNLAKESAELQKEKILQHFGPGYFNAEGKLNRTKLAEKIFNSPEERIALERILHPVIISLMKQRMECFEKDAKKYIVIAPLIFEADIGRLFDYVILLSCGQQQQIKRLMEREQIAQEKAFERIRVQLPDKEKGKKADFIIDTSCNIGETEERIIELLEKIGF
ncbi:MAG: dephospho-CoA kinase [Candidatus Auribacterota bacterium]|nr:dephospho-CoA kinase [Candidatus Auribacterota bacterium]